jgi:putative tryptophan/tyrosine transport system substrate-binding protein
MTLPNSNRIHAATSRAWKQLAFLAICTVLASHAFSQDRPRKVGLLWGGATAEGTAPYWAPFMQGMREHGWVQGRNVEFLERFDEGGKAELPQLAAELVALGVDVLAVSDYVVPAALAATTTVPIVVIDAYDPIAEGMTSDLRKPRGNLTGVSW